MNSCCPKLTAQKALLVATVLLVGAARASAQGKTPLPDAAAQNQAQQLIRDVYGKDFEEAKTSAEKNALAQKLLDQAAKSKGDLAGHFVLLQTAKDVAVEAADIETALEAVERIVETYEVDPMEMKRECMEAVGQAARFSSQRAALAEQAFSLIDAAVAEDNFEAAAQFGEIAQDAARSAREFSLLKQIVARMKEVEQLEQAHTEYKKSLALLEDNPIDPRANLAAGRYLCLAKGDWERGIPMLALGSDPGLKAVAVKELKAATSPDAQVALGDAWFDLAEAKKGEEKTAFLLRAGSWYQQALPNVASALVKVKVQKRLDDIAELQRSLPELAIWGASPPIAPSHDKQAKQSRRLPARAPRTPRRTAIRLLRVLEGHENSVTSVGFSREGNLLASGSLDSTLKLWDVSSGKVLATLQADQGPVWCVAFSPAGTILASGGGNNRATLWDPSSREPLRTLEHPGLVRGLAFSADGSLLATACTDKIARVWDVGTGRVLCVLEGHTHYVPSVAFSPDGHTLASAGNDGTVRLWDVRTGRARSTLTDNLGLVMSVVFSPDGRTLASAGSPPPRLWDIRTHKVRTTLVGHTQQVDSITFHPRGALVAAGSRDGTVRFWEADGGRLLHTVETGTEQIFISFSCDGSLLAGAGHDNKVRVWELYVDAR